jgi:transposase
MNRDQFWLTETQLAKIAPHVQTDTRGKPRVSDRRVISSIVHVLKSGGQPLCPLGCQKCVGVDLFHALASAGGPSVQQGCDGNAIRRQVEDRGTMPNIPPRANRIWKNCFSPVLYRDRNAIERMFCRLKDFRRVATRYDRLAAAVSCWL